MNTSVSVLLTFTQIISFFKETDFINNECSDLTLFSIFHVLRMSGICSQWHVVVMFLFNVYKQFLLQG